MAGFEIFPIAKKAIVDGVQEGVAPGMVAGVYSLVQEDCYELFAHGRRRLALQGLPAQPMELDTIFDLASVSKVIATATLIATLVDRGLLQYDDPVRKFIPEFTIPHATIEELLAHTAGLPAWAPLFESVRSHFGTQDIATVPIRDRQRLMRKLVLGIGPDRARNVQAIYSDLTFLTLGFIVEEVLALPFDHAVKRHLWEPMGLTVGEKGLHYKRIERAASMTRDARYAATEACPWRKTILQGQVHDDNCYSMGGYSGHAGVFGHVTDVLDFSKKLLHGFLTPKTLARMWTRVPRPAGCERTPGWDTPSGEMPAFGSFFSRSSVGHLGFTGTSLWIDPARGLAITLLTNRVHPSRDHTAIRAFRNRFHNALAQDLGLV